MTYREIGSVGHARRAFKRVDLRLRDLEALTAEVPAASSDGVVRLYVNASTGDDDNAGAVTTPLQIIAEAVRRWERWLLYGYDADFMIDIAGDTSAEPAVDIRPPVAPRKRLRISAADSTLTTLVSGNVANTSISRYLERSGGSAWTVDAYKGKVVQVLSAGVIIARAMIRDNTASRLNFCQELSFSPTSAHTYRIVEPTVELGVWLTLPWAGNGQWAPLYTQDPYIGFMNVRFTHFSQTGGTVVATACEAEFVDGYVNVQGGGALFGGSIGTIGVADVLWDITATVDFDLIYGCGFCLLTGSSLFVSGAMFLGVAVSPDFYFTNGAQGTMIGGACHGGSYSGAADSSEVNVLGGGYTITNCPFLFKGMTAIGLRSKNHSYVRVYGAQFASLGPNVSAMSAEVKSHIDIIAGSLSSDGAADVPGYALAVTNLSTATVAAGITMPGTVNDLLSDTTAAAHAALVAGTPLAGTNGSVIARSI